MGDPLTTLSSGDVPHPAWNVRRRRYGDRRWLIRHNEIYEIDAATDAVWLACRDGSTVGGIVSRVADRLSLPRTEALELAGRSIAWLHEMGLISLPRR